MINPIIKRFNTIGPFVQEKHYILPVLSRLPDVQEMIDGEYYFIIHAPRQSGKTTLLHALTNRINSKKYMYCIYRTLESCDMVTDIPEAMSIIVADINNALKLSGVKNLKTLSFPD
ncbi:MAG: hypothetical protein LBR53_03780 [Deltaproteobacteria bacterium]|jgi:predicted AAA+ superfamily ATPase|nr:hypothetical protein [Deltaproteobacteria bacterium]